MDETLHFARIWPIVGHALRGMRVAVVGVAQAAPLVELLAASGVREWVWVVDGEAASAALRLKEALAAHHGPALQLSVTMVRPAAWVETLQAAPPDLLLVVGGEQLAGLAPGALPCATLLVWPPEGSQATWALVRFQGDGAPDVGAWMARQRAVPALSSDPTWPWQCAAPLCAFLARAMLLRGTAAAPAEIERLWHQGDGRWWAFGAGHPGAVACGPADRPPLVRSSGEAGWQPVGRRGRVLLAGLGSLGSVAAEALAPSVAGLVLADPERVDAFNPVRQAYAVSTIGQPKALALAAALQTAGVPSVALPDALQDEAQVAALVRAHGVSAALVATGSDADFAISRGLAACGVPHVVGRCYPRARYWEGVVVEGDGPGLDAVRGHLRLGPLPPPTPEMQAAYGGAGALEAEPATRVESGWAALWLARLVAQLVQPPGLRDRWFLAWMDAGQRCLVGGIRVEPTPDGPAYGVALPGMVHGWRVEAISRGDWD